MKRSTLTWLSQWLTSTDRKPLVIRGARQVGKTWIVRHFAEINKKTLIEINFERHPEHASLFNSSDPHRILLNLSTLFNQHIDPQHCLLFLDEIQVAPHLFSKLRWFAEDMPQLPVIAAGSLLEFLLAEHSFSMPVGRISYMHLEPLSFEEFLLASNKKTLCDYVAAVDFTVDIPTAIHEQLMSLFKEYVLVGGLPAAVLNWTTERSLQRITEIQHNLMSTYRDDFAKYQSRIAVTKLEEVLKAIPTMLGEKFVCSRASASTQAGTTKQILDLFSKARLCHRVISCSANGIPLGAEINEKHFKEIFLDTGLCSASLGLNLNHITNTNELIMVNKGGLAEQSVGQLLRTITPPYIEPTLYYWLREEKSSNAEIDYIIQHGNTVIPIEVKAGSHGSLKSLHFFMGLKKLSLAVRVNSNLPSKVMVETKDRSGHQVVYTLLSIPFYLIGQLHRLLDIKNITT